MTGTYFAHSHRTTASLHIVVQGMQWPENRSRWVVNDVDKKSMRALTSMRLASVGKVNLSGCDAQDSAEQWL